MSTILKATDRNGAVQSVAFNFDDMAAKANQYLEKVRAEAAQIVAKAHQEAVAIRKQAETDGRKAGQAALERLVEERAQQQLGEQLRTLLPALQQAVEDIRHARQAWLAHWEKSAVHVAAAIAARLIRREIPQHPEITLALVREALELAAGSSQVRIHLNPADHQALSPQVHTLIQELAAVGTPEVIADGQIAPGACRVETRFGVIDQQFEAQLARIEEELT
jgi:flagellar assembly protein FliH